MKALLVISLLLLGEHTEQRYCSLDLLCKLQQLFAPHKCSQDATGLLPRLQSTCGPPVFLSSPPPFLPGPRMQLPQPRMNPLPAFPFPLTHRPAIEPSPQQPSLESDPIPRISSQSLPEAPQFTKCYTGVNQTGRCTVITTNIPDLGYGNFDNQIQSVLQRGTWFYYLNKNYSMTGMVYYTMGSLAAVTLPSLFRNVISSVRPLISNQDLEKYHEMLTGYEGFGFTGTQYSWPTATPSLGHQMSGLSSLAIIGRTPWTIYTEDSYTGYNLCVFPKDHPKPSYGGISVGLYPNITILAIPNNTIRSVKKGCYSKVIVKPPYIPTDGHTSTGAWGRII